MLADDDDQYAYQISKAFSSRVSNDCNDLTGFYLAFKEQFLLKNIFGDGLLDLKASAQLTVDYFLKIFLRFSNVFDLCRATCRLRYIDSSSSKLLM